MIISIKNTQTLMSAWRGFVSSLVVKIKTTHPGDFEKLLYTI